MADVTISQLTSAIPLSGAVFPFSQGGQTNKASMADLPFFKYVAKAYGSTNTTANTLTTAILNSTKRNDLFNGVPVFNTSSYKYTCPVTGLYYASCWSSFGSINKSTPLIRLEIQVDNSSDNFIDTSTIYGSMAGYGQGYDCRTGLSLTDFFYCRAGYKIYMKVYSQVTSMDYGSLGYLTVALANYAE